MKVRRLALLTVAALMTLMVMPLGVAAASDVLIETYVIDTSSPTCAGTVTLTQTGTIISIARFDADGNLVFVSNVYADLKTTFTSNSTGESITSVRGAIERRTIESDGGYTRMTAGLFGEVILPGSGVIAMNTGLLVVTFDAYGDIVDISVTPTRDGAIANYVCAYLA